MPTIKKIRQFPIIQADATLAQAAAVQNTWYTVLDTTNVRVFHATCSMATAAEDLEVKITVDGQTWTGSQAAAVAGTFYQWRKDSWYTTTLGPVATGSGMVNLINNAYLDAASFKFEVRKTTANGANTLSGRVVYAKW